MCVVFFSAIGSIEMVRFKLTDIEINIYSFIRYMLISFSHFISQTLGCGWFFFHSFGEIFPLNFHLFSRLCTWFPPLAWRPLSTYFTKHRMDDAVYIFIINWFSCFQIENELFVNGTSRMRWPQINEINVRGAPCCCWLLDFAMVIDNVLHVLWELKAAFQHKNINDLKNVTTILRFLCHRISAINQVYLKHFLSPWM